MSWQDKIEEAVLEALKEGHRVNEVHIGWTLYTFERPQIMEISYSCTKVEQDESNKV